MERALSDRFVALTSWEHVSASHRRGRGTVNGRRKRINVGCDKHMADLEVVGARISRATT